MEIFDIAQDFIFVLWFVCCFDEDDFVSFVRSEHSQEQYH